jgi:Tannase-like family of unknown function (DUF6351)
MRHGRLIPWLSLFMLAATAMAARGAMSDIAVVSSRPDLVSGADVLVEARAGAPSAATATVFLNGARTTARFHRDAGGRLIALVSGASPGRNVVEARVGRTTEAIVVFEDFPLSGPMFSGPQQQPWLCQTDSFRLPNGDSLGSATGADCAIARPVVQYVYLDRDNHLKPLSNPTQAPSDTAVTTTTEGKQIPFVVRVETGTLNRGIYQIALLDDPTHRSDPSPWQRLFGWNGKLVYTFGGGCGPGYHQGTTTGGVLTKLYELGKGYAVASSTLNVWQNTCNTAVSAETLAMVKARFATVYGLPDFTIGEGESGGAKSQLMIADNYPGLLDGILPGIQTGPDGVTTNPTVLDCTLLANYFNGKTKLAWSYAQKTAVAGWAGWNNCERQPDQPARRASWNGLYSPNYAVATAHMPAQGIGCAPEIPQASIYDRERNPHGARCDIYSNQINFFGETAPGSGQPRRPFDSVGIQYGLGAFNSGTISAEQFVELNERIGGYSEDGDFIDQRTVGDLRAITIAYQTGQILSGGGGLRTTPIIDLRRYTELGPDIHDRVASFSTRARLLHANGEADNYVMYTFPAGQAGPLGSEPVGDIALDQMTRWLKAISQDRSTADPAAKVIRNKPSGVADGCWDATLTHYAEIAQYRGAGHCNDLFPAHANPRLVAGMALAHDVIKCQLKPIDPADYQQPIPPPLMERLRKVFPDGVCDYDKPGVGQQALKGGWYSYPAPGQPKALSTVGAATPARLPT